MPVKTRPKDAFLIALQADFRRHGKAAIAAVRAEKPLDYLKLVAAIVPRQDSKENPFDDIGDAELAALIAATRTALASAARGADGADAAD